ncbi:MAG: type II toxin-antitoxin system RelE/ParE family toxin [Rhizobacter sp.]|nr:type II toxin-antitoxin system RelE/ParE family toxin [Chlorobiales bacterium]
MYKSAEILQVFPLRGRIVLEPNDKAVREIIIEAYRIIYEIKDKQLKILAVIHGRRDLSKAAKPQKKITRCPPRRPDRR